MLKRACLSGAVSALAALAWIQRPDIVVGALEYAVCADTPFVAVRPLFAKTGGRWTSLEEPAAFERVVGFPERVWTIAFDGRTIGTVRTADARADQPARKEFPRQRVLKLVPRQVVPSRTYPKYRFDSWCGPVPSRPFVAVSAPNSSDPEVWKPLTPLPDVRVALLPAFRAAVDSVFVCPPSASKPVLFRYGAKDLSVERAYRSANGTTIVALQVHSKELCDDMSPESGLQWFVLGDHPRFLHWDMELIDAGDYDGDGKSELVFWYDSYNANGYVLFADNFATRVPVIWGYH